MRTIKITATFAYDEEMMGDREEERAWFYDLLITEKLRVLSDEIGDEIGWLAIKYIHQTRICPLCHWEGAEEDCLDYKHPVGTFLCPQCYEVTEKL